MRSAAAALALVPAILVLLASVPAAHAQARIVGDRIEPSAAITFALDRATLRPESEAALTEVATLLGAHPEIERVRVEHHRDAHGGAERGRLLGEQRARAVADFLAVHGVDPLRLDSAAIPPCRTGPGCDRGQARHTVLRIVALTSGERARLQRLRERRAVFDALGSAAVRCGGARTLDVGGRIGVALSTACFFAPGTTTLRREAAPLIELIAREAGAHRARRYTVTAEAGDRASQPWATAAAQSAALVRALVSAGVGAERLTASARAASDEEVYDGPAHLAPGEPLIVVALDADIAELR